MKKVRMGVSLTPAAAAFLRRRAGSERKMGEALTEILAEAERTEGSDEAGIYRQIALLNQKLAALKKGGNTEN